MLLPKLRADPLPVTRVLVRPATRADADQVTELITDTPGGLPDILGSRKGALRILRKVFLIPGSLFGFPHTLVAEADGTVVGEMVRLPGSLWKRLRWRTGLGMLIGTGPREAWRLPWRGDPAGRAVAPIPAGGLYVGSLAVAAAQRGQGVGGGPLGKGVEGGRGAKVRGGGRG